MNKMPKHIKNDPIYLRVWNIIYRKDKNILWIITGATGDCKSGTGITLAYDLDIGGRGQRRFTINRIVFNPQDFLKLVRSNLPSGSVIIWDEMGVEHDAREYYTLKNRLINKVMRTFRERNLILIMTTPTLPDLDIGTRRLLHIFTTMKGKIGKGNYAEAKVKWTITKTETGESLHPYPRFINNGVKFQLDGYCIRKPPIELEEPYKKMKRKETKEWYKTYQDQIKYMEREIGEKQLQQQSASIPISELEKKALEEQEKYFDYEKNKFLVPLLEDGLSISGKKADRLGSLLNTKLKRGEITIKASPSPP